MDLSIVWHMEHRSHRPLVGPFLSIPDIYTPPTYYYLSWAFYHLSPSPDGVRMGYLLMDIVNMAIVVALAFSIGNRNAAALAGLLYATSRTLMYHGRAYWQPFPIQVFLSLMLVFFWFAYRKKSLPLLWSGAVSYTVALSVYPSPLLLFPFVMYHLTRWYQQIKRTPLLHALGKAGIMLACTTICIYFPQLIFEYQHGFPTFHALTAVSSLSFLPLQFLQTTLSHIGLSVTNVIQSPGMFPESFWALLYIILLIQSYRMSQPAQVHKAEPPMTLSRFFPPLILLSGFFITHFIPDYAPQRIWAVMPIIILVSAIIIEKAFRSGPRAAAIAGILLLVYLSGNIGSVYKDFMRTPINAIGLTKSIAETIIADMDKSMIAQEETILVYILPDNSSPHYQLNRILYWLIASGKFHIPLTAEGNRLDYPVYMPAVTQSTVYLLCEQFVTPEETREKCVTPFIKANSAYSPIAQFDDPELSLTILRKQ